jgi:hypothetical protein
MYHWERGCISELQEPVCIDCALRHHVELHPDSFVPARLRAEGRREPARAG